MHRTIIVLAALALLSGCADGARFAGFDNCSADGSVVWMEYPNSSGTYASANNAPCKT